jgi:hypothetical protein
MKPMYVLLVTAAALFESLVLKFRANCTCSEVSPRFLQVSRKRAYQTTDNGTHVENYPKPGNIPPLQLLGLQM